MSLNFAAWELTCFLTGRVRLFYAQYGLHTQALASACQREYFFLQYSVNFMTVH